MWNKRNMLREENWAIKIDVTLAKRVSPGDTVIHGDRQCVVLRAAYVGDGLYSVRLGDQFIFGGHTAVGGVL